MKDTYMKCQIQTYYLMQLINGNTFFKIIKKHLK